MESYHLYTTFTVANELLRHAFGDCEIYIYFDFMAPSPPRQTGNVACPAQIATPRCGGFPVTTLQAVTWAGAARRIPRRRNSAERRCTPSRRTGPGVQRPEAPTTNEVLLAACRVLASRAGETSRAERSHDVKCSHNKHLQHHE